MHRNKFKWSPFSEIKWFRLFDSSSLVIPHIYLHINSGNNIVGFSSSGISFRIKLANTI